MTSFLIALLVALLVICVVAAIVAFILSKIPGLPAWSQSVVWAVAALVFLIWLLQNMSRAGLHI